MCRLISIKTNIFSYFYSLTKSKSRKRNQSTRRSTSTAGRRRSGSSYHHQDRNRDYASSNSVHHPRLAVATTEGGDCELGGSTTILQHTPGHSPLRIIDRSQMSASAVCHTHPSKKIRSINAFSGDDISRRSINAFSGDDISRKNSTKASPQTIRPKSAAGGAGNISATTAVAVVAAKATTALVCARDPTNKSDVEL